MKIYTKELSHKPCGYAPFVPACEQTKNGFAAKKTKSSILTLFAKKCVTQDSTKGKYSNQIIENT